MEALEHIFFSPAAIVAVVITITNYAKKSIPISGRWIQVFSWGVSIVICSIGYISKIGMFSGMDVYMFIFLSILVGLSSNGAYDFLIKKPMV